MSNIDPNREGHTMISTIDHPKFSAFSRPLAEHSVQTVLVVDDDPSVRLALKLRFQAAGYRVHTAADGRQAIALFKELMPELVILDVHMPGIDGFEVCQTIKQLKDVPVVFITGDQRQIVQRYLPNMLGAVGGNRFVRKPFSVDSLLRLVEGLLCKASPAAG